MNLLSEEVYCLLVPLKSERLIVPRSCVAEVIRDSLPETPASKIEQALIKKRSVNWYGYNYYETSIQEPDNPKGPLQGVYRVLRGGCWKSLKEDLRCSRRHRNNPGTVNGTYGFRCAADVEEN